MCNECAMSVHFDCRLACKHRRVIVGEVCLCVGVVVRERGGCVIMRER